MTFIDIIFKTHFHENRLTSAKVDMGTKKQWSHKPSCFLKEGKYGKPSLYKCADIFTTVHRSRATVFLFLDFISWRRKVNSCCLCLCISLSPFKLFYQLTDVNKPSKSILDTKYMWAWATSQELWRRAGGVGVGMGSTGKAWVLSICTIPWRSCSFSLYHGWPANPRSEIFCHFL